MTLALEFESFCNLFVPEASNKVLKMPMKKLTILNLI